MVVGPSVDAECGRSAGLLTDPYHVVCLNKRSLGVMVLAALEVGPSTFCCAKRRGLVFHSLLVWASEFDGT